MDYVWDVGVDGFGVLLGGLLSDDETDESVLSSANGMQKSSLNFEY